MDSELLVQNGLRSLHTTPNLVWRSDTKPSLARTDILCVLSIHRQKSFAKTLLDVNILVHCTRSNETRAAKAASTNPLPNQILLGEFIASNILEFLVDIAVLQLRVKLLTGKLIKVCLHISFVVHNYATGKVLKPPLVQLSSS